MGFLNLVHGRASQLILGTEKDWPSSGYLVVDGFKYDRIGERSVATQPPKLSVDDLEKWLRRNFRCLAEPYEQMAAALRNDGRIADARRIGIAKQVALRRQGNANFGLRAWSLFLGATVGHGYRPWLLVFWMIAFVALGTVVFRCARACGVIIPSQDWVYRTGSYETSKGKALPEPYPVFEPFLYSLDVLLPFVNLHEKEFWFPRPREPGDKTYIVSEVYFILQQLAGWGLTALILAVLGGVIKRD
ncbi:MAG: hypothetical protein WA005_16710 [Candidatus Binataceae bacterium]